MVGFDKFAGQLVADGVGVNSPVTALEAGGTAGSATINGLMAKVSRVFIEDTKIFGDPFGAAVRKVDDPYGVGIETAGFMSGAVNKKRDGTCQPKGTVSLASQVNYINWAYNSEVRIYDREVNKAVLSAEDAGRYAAEKLKTPLKTIAQNHYRSWLQLVSDVCDGTRTISSFDRTDGSLSPPVGTPVTYAATVTGYAGIIGDTDLVIPAPIIGELSTVSADDALEYVQILEGIASDFQYESDENNVLGIENFCVGKPYLIAETKTLNAVDVALSMNAGYKGFPTVSGRDYLRRFTDIVEVDAFPAIPTSETYKDKRLAGVLIDRDAMREVVKYADVEPMRCANERATGYNFQGESIMAIWRGAPSYALLADVPEED